MATATKTKARIADREEPEARMPPRMEDDRSVIRNRKGEPVSLKVTGDQDPFYFDRAIIPAGWDYAWKRISVYGWEDTQNQVDMAQNGWEAVPAERHDGMFMPKGYKGNIERRGQMLMERDERLTARSRDLDRQRARGAVIAARANMAGKMPTAITDFTHPDAVRNSGVKVERTPVLPDGNYQYKIDD